MRPRSDIVIRLIALFKLVKAAGLVALGLGALSMRHDSALSIWVHALSVDPHGKYVTQLLTRISSLDAHTLREIGIGSLLYSLVFVTEGIGLMMRRAWAEVMTVIITTSFVPIEIYELWERPSWARFAVTVANALVVLYLLRRLHREQHWPFHRPAPTTAVAGVTAERTGLP
jgi:uncharacterized membrane protein (DUF2068 family)